MVNSDSKNKYEKIKTKKRIKKTYNITKKKNFYRPRVRGNSNRKNKKLIKTIIQRK